MTSRNNIILDLQGNKITSVGFKKAVESFFEIIENVSGAFVAGRDNVQWIINVENGSAQIIAHPESLTGNKEYGYRSISVIKEGLKQLEDGTNSLPRYFTNTSLKAVRQLVTVIDPDGEYVEKIKIRCDGDPVVISTKSLATVDVLLKYTYDSLGSVEGRMETITERGGLKFTVFLSLNDKPVRCSIGDDLRERALQSFGKRVSVNGMVKYGKDGIPLSITVNSIRLLRDKSALPTVNDMQGIFTK